MNHFIPYEPQSHGERALYFMECMVSRFGKGTDGPILQGHMPDGGTVLLGETDSYAQFTLFYNEGGVEDSFILDYTVGGVGGCCRDLLQMAAILTRLFRKGLIVDESWPVEMMERGHDIRN